MPAEPATPEPEHEAGFTFGVTDYGFITVKGTNEFVQFAMDHAAPILKVLIEKHVKQCIERGENPSTALNALMDKFEEKCLAALASPGERKTVEFSSK